MAKKKKELEPEEQKREDEKELSINEMLLFYIQEKSKHSTGKIVTYFHEVMEAQIKELKAKIKDNSDDTWYRTANKGYYPGTDIYYSITATRDLRYDWGSDYGRREPIKWTRWKCSINLPTKVTKFDNNKLKTILAEYVMIGDSAAADAIDPRTKPKNIKRSVENLNIVTESTEE